MKTNSKAFNALVYPYILNAIDNSGYDSSKKLTTDKEKLEFLAQTFVGEYCYPENIRYYGTIQDVMKNWIMGLPSSFNIDFENYRIIEIAKEWHSLRHNATEKSEDKIIENWFNLIAFKTFQLFKLHGIDIYSMIKK
jgi:hypothetical protein